MNAKAIDASHPGLKPALDAGKGRARPRADIELRPAIDPNADTTAKQPASQRSA
jgi:hypothetical protein